MARTRQVRLEPDVVALLEQDPDSAGLSLSATANRALRLAYDDADSEPEQLEEEPRAMRRAPVMVTGQRLAAGRGGRARRVARPCAHPKARMVGARCGVCGREVR